MEAVDQIHTIALFAKWGLKMNCEKTEITFISKGTQDWKNTCKLGSLLDINCDIQRRKILAQRMSNRCWKLWDKKFKLTLKTKVMFYNSLIRPILLYNCGTWGLTKQQLDALESFNRRLLRKVIGIYHPNKLSCEAVYQVTNTKPLHGMILKQRWNLFHKVLLMDEQSPAMYWTRQYFTCRLPRYRGRGNRTLAITLINDLHTIGFKLTDEQDLNRLQHIARYDEQKWSKMITSIFEKHSV